MRTLSGTEVWEALAEVPDPEIPVVSVVDLGLVHAVEHDGERLRVELLPTFVGCPALELIRDSVAGRLAGMAPVVEVEMTFAEPWTSERITAGGGTSVGRSIWFSRAVAAQAVRNSRNWDTVKMKISRPRIGPNARPVGLWVTAAR